MNIPVSRGGYCTLGVFGFNINREFKIGDQGKYFWEQGSRNRDQGRVIGQYFGFRSRSLVLVIILGRYKCRRSSLAFVYGPFQNFWESVVFVMKHAVYPLLTLLIQWMSPRYNARMRFLEFQVEMLRSRIDADRIITTPEERRKLVALGEQFGHEIDDVLKAVVPETYRRWIREKVRGVELKRVGRSRIAQAVRDLIHRISGENKGWGYRRICGEFKKLGIPIGASTVRKIMVDNGLEPPPYLRVEEPPIGWKTFINAHMDSMVACDFFTKNIYSVFGGHRVFVLVFIHLGTRKVFHSFPTEHPTHNWVMQQCRNAAMWLDEEGLQAAYLIRDRDVVYSESMKEFWRSEGVKVIETPVRAPKANAFCESFIGTFKRECLNHFTRFSRAQLNYICKTWFRYYNTERPHRGKGIDNNVLDVDFEPTTQGRIKCKEELGGIIKSYYREAA